MLDKDRENRIRSSKFLSIIRALVWHRKGNFKPGIVFECDRLTEELNDLQNRKQTK